MSALNKLYFIKFVPDIYFMNILYMTVHIHIYTNKYIQKYVPDEYINIYMQILKYPSSNMH